MATSQGSMLQVGQLHTNSAGTSDIGARYRTMKTTITVGGSVLHSSLTVRNEPAVAAAPSSANSANGLKVSGPGCITTSTPAKPTRVAAQRRTRTLSPRRRAAPAVANSGAVKLIAVASAIGM